MPGGFAVHLGSAGRMEHKRADLHRKARLYLKPLSQARRTGVVITQRRSRSAPFAPKVEQL